MAKDENERLDGADVTCFNCMNKSFCNVVNPMWDPNFKKNLGNVAERPRMVKFFEGVERMLARICDYFSPNI